MITLLRQQLVLNISTLHTKGPIKRFRLLPDIRNTNVARMSGKNRAKVGWSVQTVSTQAKTFENKREVLWMSGKSLIQFKLDPTSIRQASDFFQGFRQCRGRVQTQPTFVIQTKYKFVL